MSGIRDTDLYIGSYKRITEITKEARNTFKQSQADRTRCQTYNEQTETPKDILADCKQSFGDLDAINPIRHFLHWYTGYGLLVGFILVHLLCIDRTGALVNIWLLEKDLPPT
jgi:hypothetical protein